MIAASQPSFRGKPLANQADAFGLLRTSTDVLHDRAELRRRMAEDGYLFMPGLLDRGDVLDARLTIMAQLAARGFVDTAYPLLDGVISRRFSESFFPELTRDNPQLTKVLYAGAMIDFYTHFLGGPVRHFDYTWCRAKSPGESTATNPHYDIVYMGRGTKDLYTSWTPLGDIPVTMGGLMILEGSHRHEEIKSTYGQMDVDIYCTNYPDAGDIESGRKTWQAHVNSGAYSNDAVALRQTLGGRWLTADFRAGDVLIFGMFTMHASMDNHTDRVRLSTDTRYQLASEPVDERWIGETPIGHGPEGKKGMIC